MHMKYAKKIHYMYFIMSLVTYEKAIGLSVGLSKSRVANTLIITH